jgi:hypothetical protein
LTLPEAVKALGYDWKSINEYLDADEYDDVWHSGYSKEDALRMDVVGMDDVEKIFPISVAVAVEAAERQAIAGDIRKNRIDTLIDAFDKFMLPVSILTMKREAWFPLRAQESSRPFTTKHQT